MNPLQCTTMKIMFLNHFFRLFLIADHVDIDEAKSIFEANYSHVYFILYDTFVQAETNLRQRGKFWMAKTPIKTKFFSQYNT